MSIENYRQFSLDVAEKFDLFWQNNELGYDKNGKLIRTNKPRKRPKHDFDFTLSLIHI